MSYQEALSERLDKLHRDLLEAKSTDAAMDVWTMAEQARELEEVQTDPDEVARMCLVEEGVRQLDKLLAAFTNGPLDATYPNAPMSAASFEASVDDADTGELPDSLLNNIYRLARRSDELDERDAPKETEA